MDYKDPKEDFVNPNLIDTYLRVWRQMATPEYVDKQIEKMGNKLSIIEIKKLWSRWAQAGWMMAALADEDNEELAREAGAAVSEWVNWQNSPPAASLNAIPMTISQRNTLKEAEAQLRLDALNERFKRLVDSNLPSPPKTTPTFITPVRSLPNPGNEIGWEMVKRINDEATKKWENEGRKGDLLDIARNLALTYEKSMFNHTNKFGIRNSWEWRRHMIDNFYPVKGGSTRRKSTRKPKHNLKRKSTRKSTRKPKRRRTRRL